LFLIILFHVSLKVSSCCITKAAKNGFNLAKRSTSWLLIFAVDHSTTGKNVVRFHCDVSINRKTLSENV